MKIVCISDTHCHQPIIPDGDILIHAGDISASGGAEQIRKQIDWLASLPHKHKILVPGNHDWWFQDGKSANEKALFYCATKAVHCLADRGVEIEGVKIWGSPWQPEFYNWAFNLPRGRALAERWALIPQDTQILVTHGPPYGILDEVPRGEKVGCQDLLDKVVELGQKQLKLHVFGHIHYSYGSYYMGAVQYVNAAVCNESYRPVNPPIVVEI
jgi:predicted phosphohydrolase